MDFLPNKRRKTSPATSIRVSGQDSQLQPDAFDDERFLSRRELYMSPPKASLARFNPGLLSPSKTTTPRRRGSSGSQGASSQGLIARPVIDRDAVMRALLMKPDIAVSATTLAPDRETDGQVFLESPRRRSRTPVRETTTLKKAKLSVMEDIRASSPEEAIEADVVVQDVQYVGQRESGPNGSHTQLHQMAIAGVMPTTEPPQSPSTPSQPNLQSSLLSMGQQEEEEPSLPSTPVQLGLEKPPEPAKGLLFSSPSRRPKRIGIGRARSTPLKPHPENPVQQSQRPDSLLPGLGPRVYIINTPKSLPTAQEAEFLRVEERLAALRKQLQEIGTRILQESLVTGWNDNRSKGTKDTKGVEKQNKEKLARSTKVSHLREELFRLEHANATASDSAGGESREQEATDRPSSGNAATGRSPAPSKLPSLSQRLARFLPFSSRPPPPIPKPPSQQDHEPSQILRLEPLEDDCVPFTITTSDSTLLTSIDEDSLLHSQIIALSSPSKIFVLRLKVTLDIVSQAVTQLHVIELSDWAETELGGWLRGSSQDRSIAAIGTAFGHYWMVCLQRFKCWTDAVRKHSDLITDDRGFVKISSPPSNADLPHIIPLLCWHDLNMARGTLSLTIQWRIFISSDNGTVDSDVSAQATYPETWRRTDAGAELDKMGEAFRMLVEERGVTEAIGVLADLLFPG